MLGFKPSHFDVLDASLDLKRNYFIEASAGTGKTFTIENAFVRLLEEGIPLERILVVTFTRAATLELKTRIRRNLEQRQFTQARLKNASLLDDYKIFTIHGFCFHTLKEYSLETGFSLNQVEENASTEIFKRIFKDFLRTGISKNEIHPWQLERILKPYRGDLHKFCKDLSKTPLASTKSYVDIINAIRVEVLKAEFDFPILREELLKHASKFGKMCDRKRQLKPEVLKGIELFILFIENLTHQNQLSAMGTHILSDPIFDLPILKMTPENWLGDKELYPKSLEKMNQKIFPLLKELSDVNTILDCLRHHFKQFLSQVCNQEDLFFYDDLIKSMQRCVREPDFAAKVRAHYQIVLIDEFQDTDSVQWEIFSTLFYGYIPLYLVGDPKQSIYRFRGADLYTYFDAKKMIGDKAYVTLTRNFRSEATLVEAFNDLFSRVPKLITLPKTDEPLFIPNIDAALEKTNEGKIIFYRPPNEKALFSFIIHEIERLHQIEGIPYSDCAILVRDHDQAKRFCLQCTLPFVTKKSETLLDSDALFLLEDLLLACYSPRDRSACAKALGACLFGIDLENLNTGLKEKKELFFHLNGSIKSHGILYWFRALTEKVIFPSRDLYLDFLQLVELIAENCQSFEEYLPFLQKLKMEDPDSETIKKRAHSQKEAVQIMTTHVSKGLEFPIVFPIALIVPFDSDNEEEYSEKMRQLYVAFTRAKKRLYLPLIGKESSPLELFLKEVLQQQTLEEFIKDKPFFELAECGEPLPLPVKSLTYQPTSIVPLPELTFPPSAIYSYSSLASKADRSLITIHEENRLPPGTETGILLHRIFEHLDFSVQGRDLEAFIHSHILGTHLETWAKDVQALVVQALYFPIESPNDTFCLADVDRCKMKKEMEFLYSSDDPRGYFKGFMDLFFEHKGHYYVVDWKSNLLEDYTQEGQHRAITHYNYDLQAHIYRQAALRLLNLYQVKEAFEAVYFFFLRGIDGSKKTGVYRCA